MTNEAYDLLLRVDPTTLFRRMSYGPQARVWKASDGRWFGDYGNAHWSAPTWEEAVRSALYWYRSGRGPA